MYDYDLDPPDTVPDVDLHEGPNGPVLIPPDALLVEWPGCCISCKGWGVGGPASGPETNGRCGDCYGHGHTHEGECGPEVDICPEGCGLINVADQSTETSGYEEAERHYYVIWLECGHEIALGPLPLPRPVD